MMTVKNEELLNETGDAADFLYELCRELTYNGVMNSSGSEAASKLGEFFGLKVAYCESCKIFVPYLNSMTPICIVCNGNVDKSRQGEIEPYAKFNKPVKLTRKAKKYLYDLCYELYQSKAFGIQAVIDVCEILGIESKYCEGCDADYPQVDGTCQVCGWQNNDE